MKILSIECSASPASAAITQDGKIISSAFLNVKTTHSETLLSLVKCVTDSAKLKVSDIDAFAVAAGPGSFTGIRIGISAIKGLAAARNVPCFAVSTLKAMAENIYDENVIINTVMDARCGQFYNALFERKDGKILRLTPDRAVLFCDLITELKNLNRPFVTLGDGADLFYSMCEGIGEKTLLVPEQQKYQNAVSVGLCAYFDKENNLPISSEALQPFYLRLPQAEQELKLKTEANK